MKEIEEMIFEPHINQITGTDVNKEYKNILDKNKNKELWQG